MENSAITILRSIKGAPLSILVALFLSNGPIGHDFLCRATGYSKDSVTGGLQVLQDLGLANPLPGKRYNGWTLSVKAKQLELFGSNPIFQDSTFTTTTNDHSLTILSSSSSKESESYNLGLDTHEKQAINHALRDAGIYGNTAIKLANDPFITLEYVNAHIAKAKKERTDIALCIHRMREHDPMPEERNEERHKESTGRYAEFIKY